MSRQLPALTLAELTVELGSRARAVETLRWLFSQRPLPTGLPLVIPGVSHRVWRPFLERSGLVLPKVTERQQSPDGTTKYALEFDGTNVETVRIPAKGRSTICISSQAGCTRKCVFCATKELGFIRQLKAEEMVAQYLLARSEAPAAQPASNVVFMGMGEPMDNLDEVLRAVEVLTQSPAPQLRQVAVTVSTSGVLPGLERFLAESNASLALSLNATTDEVRARVMPQNKTWPIEALLGALRKDVARRSGKRDYFIEYVLFKDLNDTDADADRLVALLEGIPSRVNLIPYNPYPGTGLETPSEARVRAFHERLVSKGMLTLIRWPRGREIAAACGQLVLSRDGAGFQPEASPV
ncbi:MAG: 23S rRNA (adenine(2503)-C(2))-methyltransferase RlmN [Archangium sp.]|nr:23S rRNA (adenine(2503)-C(2))-methyltransferase RlmN [Archangium sp.]